MEGQTLMKRQMARALSRVLPVWKVLEEMAASAGSRTGYPPEGGSFSKQWGLLRVLSRRLT